MKKRRWIFIVAICIIAIMLFRACSGDKHITQREAEKIANNLVGGGVTFINSEKSDSGTYIKYVFKDAKGNTFAVTSRLSRAEIDGAKANVGPYYLYVSTDYDKAIEKCNQDKITEILKSYGFGDCLGSSFNGFIGIVLEVNVGSAEENHDVLKNFVAAGVEIDAMLDLTFDREYLKNNYGAWGDSDVPGMSIRFFENMEDGDRKQVDSAGFLFSTSSDTRWTCDSLYEDVIGDIVELEIAE